jgi:hypothetical protein
MGAPMSLQRDARARLARHSGDRQRGLSGKRTRDLPITVDKSQG